MTELTKVDVYTDGACSGNPGPGGYGVVLKCGTNERELSGGYANTTNNRMELMAVIKGLEALKRPCDVTLYSDSQYIVNAMTKGWARRWQANGWKRNKNETAKNPDLWQRIIKLDDIHKINWIWVKGHADNAYNNRCDRLAVEASKNSDLLVDPGYKG